MKRSIEIVCITLFTILTSCSTVMRTDAVKDLLFDSPGVTNTVQADDYALQYEEIFDDPEAQMIVRYGDIDNMGFGWPEGFDPFSGMSTPRHSFPWALDHDDAEGTDCIMVVSSYAGSPPHGTDGYTRSTSRPENYPREITIQFTTPVPPVESAIMQIFVDDFESSKWHSTFQVRMNGVRIPEIEEVFNCLRQSGPIGKLITFQLPNSVVTSMQNGELTIFVDDPVTGAGDGFAFDFFRLLINPRELLNTGTMSGHVYDASGNQPIHGATVSNSVASDVTTDANGYYVLQNVPAGLAALTAYSGGYESATSSTDLVAGETATLNFYLNTSLPEPDVPDTGPRPPSENPPEPDAPIPGPRPPSGTPPEPDAPIPRPRPPSGTPQEPDAPGTGYRPPSGTPETGSPATEDDSEGIIEQDFELGNTGVFVTMVWIEPGEYMMGAQTNETGTNGDEYPRHSVTISKGFWMGKYEVTQEQWEAVVYDWDFYFNNNPDRPAETISWNHIHNDFLNSINSTESANPWRLPSASEWEYACRAGYDETRFWWGDDLDYSLIGDYAWYWDNDDTGNGHETHDTGQKLPNPWGLYDMNGNVWEWCEDHYYFNYNDAPSDGSAWISVRGNDRIVRGGGWGEYGGVSCRSACRGHYNPDYGYNIVGFRLVREVE